MISVKHVSKYFGSFCAVNDVSFEINSGEIVGFLGQNGAGKTTLMRLLTTFYDPTQGQILIDGERIHRDAVSLRRKIGYLPENPPLYSTMTVNNYLKYAAQLRDIPNQQLNNAVERVMESCVLSSVMDKKIMFLSKGFKQRVGIAQAMIHEPKVLILDEPMNGLDPLQVRQIRELIRSIQNETTVILSTHILSEIEQMAQRVLVLKNGKLIQDQTTQEFIKLKCASNLEEAFVTTVQE